VTALASRPAEANAAATADAPSARAAATADAPSARGRGRGGRGRGRGGGAGRPGAASASGQDDAERSWALVRAGVAAAKQGSQPVLSISLDQGSVGWPALFFLLFRLSLVVVPVSEPPHRVWNDTQLAIEQVRVLRDARHLSTVLFNLNMGPFESGAWWQQVVEGCREYRSMATPADPLFQHFLKDILEERGEHDMLGDAEHQEQVLASLPAVLANKGSKVPRSRWFHFVDCARAHDRIWSSRALVLLYVGLRAGYVRAQHNGHVVLQPTRGQAAGEVQKTPTSGAAPSVVGFLRPRCKNTLHVAAMLYLDRTVKLANRIIFTVAEPVRLWHGVQCRDLRDPTACEQFAIAQASGEFLGSLCDTVRVLRSAERLEFMGLSVSLGKPERALSKESCEVIQENEHVGLIVGFVFALLAYRIRGMSPHWLGFPLKFAALLDSRVDVQQRTLALMRERAAAWSAARELGRSAMWRRILERSPMNYMYVAIMMALGEEVGFSRVTVEMRRWARAWTLGIGTTKAVEDVFQKGRMDEMLAQSNKQVAPMRRFLSAIRSPVLCQTHNFRQVEYRSVDLTPPDERALRSSKAFFHPRFSARSIPELEDIVGKAGSATQWPSFTAQSYTAALGDVALLEHCFASNCHAQASDAWQIVFFQRGLLCKRKTETKWVWSLGPWSDSCFLSWPAARALVPGVSEAWMVSEEVQLEDLRLHVVLDVGEWEVLPVQWSAPLSTWVRSGFRDSSVQDMAALAPPSSTPQEVVKHAASNCFWDFELPTLRQVASLLQVEVGSSSLFDALRALVSKALNLRDNDAQLQQVLAIRATAPSHSLSDLLSEEVMEEIFDAGDKKVLEKEQEKASENASRALSFQEAFKKWVGSRAASAAAAASSSEPKQKKQKHKHGAPEVRYLPGDLTRDQAGTMMPVGYRIYKDVVNLRWQTFCAAEMCHVSSKSYILHGDRQAMLFVIWQAWCHSEARGGSACPVSSPLRQELEAANLL